MLTWQFKKKLFRQIKTFQKCQATTFLKGTPKSCVGFKIRLTFLNNKSKAFLSNYFCKNGEADRLQASDDKSIQQVLPFIGVLVNARCENFECTDVLLVFTR